ncbi:MAG TPA: DUF1553 domain-containing protein, partial [Bryobacteraceae bacterium]|nr:DUF1553 domain-containing protein [Bryobacteraceae bacterium]
LEAFDPVTQTLVTGQRDATTVPTQALFLMNSSFVRRQSLSLAESLLADNTLSNASRIRQAYRLTLGRTPRQSELRNSEKFIATFEAAWRSQPPTLDSAAQQPVLAKPAETAPFIPDDPDNIDRTDQVPVEDAVHPNSPKAAAWMNLVQALYASAEFRFVR